MLAASTSALSLVIWVYMVFFRGHFWRPPLLLTVPRLPPSLAPRIAVIVPARNEADVIAPAVRSLLEQDYAGPMQIIAVDDHSSDGTADVLRNAASSRAERLIVVSSEALPAGWTGKMWALSQGTQAAAKFLPDYLLFTDADIVHGPRSVSSMVALARSENLDLVSMMVKLRCKSIAERLLIPAFVFFFFMLYPPKWVNNPKRKTAAAAGGDILIRADALAKIGGIAAIRSELIDDCALARKIKEVGNIRLGLTPEVCSIRSYDGFGGIGSMISRTAFYQLRHSVWLLCGTLLGLAITYMAPPVLVFFGGWASLWAFLAWFLMTVAICPTLRFFSVSVLWAPLLPLVAAFYAVATIHSAVQYWLGRGGKWKDRAQDVTS